jgi:hypothetical protein
MARLPHGGGFAIRNSRYPEGPALVFTPAEMTAFVAGVRDGDFDDLVVSPGAAGAGAASTGTPPGAGERPGAGAPPGAGELPPRRTK